MPSSRKSVQTSSTGAEPQNHITVLAITGSPTDHSLLQGVFSHTRWRLLGASTLREATEAIPQCQVILSEADLPDGNWKDVLHQAASLSSRQGQFLLPQVIVMSPRADVQLLNEVLDSGGFNLIAKPFQSKELTQLISLAWQCRKKPAEYAARMGPGSETLLVKQAGSG